jgi:hypothetical protein
VDEEEEEEDDDDDEEGGGNESLHNFTSARGSLADVKSIVPSGEKTTLPTPAFVCALALKTTIGEGKRRCVRSILCGSSEGEGGDKRREKDSSNVVVPN